MIVYKMVRNGTHVAGVVTLHSGKCIVAWPNSVIVYDSEEAARLVHVDHMNGRGERTVFEFQWASNEQVARGMDDCLQDAMENAPFASIGGLKAREAPVVPDYVKGDEDRAAWLQGYVAQARAAYGADWRTASFGWAPAMTVNAPAPPPPDEVKP